MEEFSFDSFSLKETAAIAKKMKKLFKPTSLVFLQGDLGSGKTAFTKCLAKAFNIKEEVSSPTFVICKNYKNRKLNLFHYDLYRLSDVSEIYDLNINENLDAGGTVLIEWPEIAMSVLRKPDVLITIEKISENGRRFIFKRN